MVSSLIFHNLSPGTWQVPPCSSFSFWALDIFMEQDYLLVSRISFSEESFPSFLPLRSRGSPFVWASPQPPAQLSQAQKDKCKRRGLLGLPALPMPLPKGKGQGGRNEVRQLFSLLSSSVILVPKAPVTWVSCVPWRNTALHTTSARLRATFIVPTPQSDMIGAYILMRHHRGLISVQSSWTFQLAEFKPEERRGKY